MTNALVLAVTAVGASWSRSQEWLSCARVLWNRLHHPQPLRSPSTNDCVAGSERAALQVNGLHSDLEQSERMGRDGRLAKD